MEKTREMPAFAPVYMRAGKYPTRLIRYAKGLGDRVPSSSTYFRLDLECARTPSVLYTLSCSR